MLGFRGGDGGGSFPGENKRKGQGGGESGGWGRDWQTNRQVNTQALSKLPFSKLSFSFSPKFEHACHTSAQTERTSVLCGEGHWPRAKNQSTPNSGHKLQRLWINSFEPTLPLMIAYGHPTTCAATTGLSRKTGSFGKGSS